MVSDREQGSGPSPAFDKGLTEQVARLASELQALADRMEEEWKQRGTVTPESARQLRALRLAAAQLLGSGISRKL